MVPEEDNFYNIMVEGKEQSSGPIKQFYKCLASAGCYGLAVEVNGKKQAKKNRKEVRVFSGEMEFDLEPKPERVENPGPWFCPFAIFVLLTTTPRARTTSRLVRFYPSQARLCELRSAINLLVGTVSLMYV
jgi:hypothetical protein